MSRVEGTCCHMSQSVSWTCSSRVEYSALPPSPLAGGPTPSGSTPTGASGRERCLRRAGSAKRG
eukprot:10871791-Alexandrium_andersonii.AAC.1